MRTVCRAICVSARRGSQSKHSVVRTRSRHDNLIHRGGRPRVSCENQPACSLHCTMIVCFPFSIAIPRPPAVEIPLRDCGVLAARYVLYDVSCTTYSRSTSSTLQLLSSVPRQGQAPWDRTIDDEPRSTVARPTPDVTSLPKTSLLMRCGRRQRHVTVKPRAATAPSRRAPLLQPREPRQRAPRALRAAARNAVATRRVAGRRTAAP